MDFSMRITGTLAYHASRAGRERGQTPTEFVRAAVRQQLAKLGIDWQEREPELPGQVELPAAEPIEVKGLVETEPATEPGPLITPHEIHTVCSSCGNRLDIPTMKPSQCFYCENGIDPTAPEKAEPLPAPVVAAGEEVDPFDE